MSDQQSTEPQNADIKNDDVENDDTKDKYTDVKNTDESRKIWHELTTLLSGKEIENETFEILTDYRINGRKRRDVCEELYTVYHNALYETGADKNKYVITTATGGKINCFNTYVSTCINVKLKLMDQQGKYDDGLLKSAGWFLLGFAATMGAVWGIVKYISPKSAAP
ncbi:MAG: hypothetical protein Faunusvirus44_6 [Faunusvirus sp.]|jgi:hypothetical protein|uniref:Uncharacterized protein n=1 Tax=Faunusvirus sp. TaxID=2487766 RepID=A0A3G4ZXV3_9VIRU|nr:MAG: hypothetical protein Faunusvirus44_6 [Faunusvirus sp.]